MKPFINCLKKYSHWLGLLLFAYIIYKTNFYNLLLVIKKIDIYYLALTIIILFPILLNKAWCWNYIKKAQGIKYSLKDSFLMHCSSLYIGVLTPGRVGEVAKVFYLKKDGYSIGKSLVGAILDRLTDFIFLLFVFFMGSLFYITIFRNQVLIFAIGLVVATIILLVCYRTGILKWFFQKAINFLVPEKYKESWGINLQDFINDLRNFSFRDYFMFFFITIISWLLYYLQMYIIAEGLNLNIPFLYLSFAVTITGLATLLPISVSGIGTRDFVLILMFAPFGIAKESAIIFSALILSMTLLATFIGFLCWLKKPLFRD